MGSSQKEGRHTPTFFFFIADRSVVCTLSRAATGSEPAAERMRQSRQQQEGGRQRSAKPAKIISNRAWSPEKLSLEEFLVGIALSRETRSAADVGSEQHEIQGQSTGRGRVRQERRLTPYTTFYNNYTAMCYIDAYQSVV